MEFTLNSGTSLVVTQSSFAEANGLKKALLKSIGTVDFPKEALEEELSFNGIKTNGKLISQIIEKILAVIVDEDVEAKLFKCFERCTYGGIRITPSLFDDIKMGDNARTDYHEICIKVIQVNCLPFFKQTFSVFRDLLQTKAENQK